MSATNPRGPCAAALLLLVLVGCPDPPDNDVYLRTPTTGFNNVWETTLDGSGELWFRLQGKTKDWTHFAHDQGPLKEVSIDDQYLVALDAQDNLLTLGWENPAEVLLNAIVPHDKNLLLPTFFADPLCLFPGGCPVFQRAWGDLWFGPGQRLPPNTISWSLSVASSVKDVYYRDTADQYQIVGAANVTSVLALVDVPEAEAQGLWRRRLVVLDPWLPNDYSIEVALPHQGRFLARAVSASGSYLFVINDKGDMFTRLWDFDISGADERFFPSDFRAGVPLTEEAAKWRPANPPEPLYQVKLPIADWIQQPKIQGPGVEISDKISIHKVFEPGCRPTARILRVAGRRDGKPGYFEKNADPSNEVWNFVEAPVGGMTIIDNPPEDTSLQTLGPAEFTRFAGTGSGVDIEIEFNAYASPNAGVIRRGEATLPFELHVVDGLRVQGAPLPTQFITRARGIDDVPRIMKGGLRFVPDGNDGGLLDDLGSLGLNEDFSQFDIEVTRGQLVMRGRAGLGVTWTLPAVP